MTDLPWFPADEVVSTGGLIANGDAYRFDSTRLAVLKAAIANRDNAAVRILCLGDSRTEGDKNSVATRWVNKLADLLRTNYAVAGAPPGGLGYVPAIYIAGSLVNPIAYAGTKVAVTGALGGGLSNGTGRAYQMSGGATATLPFTGTGIDIVWTGGTSGGDFTWAIDGGAATVVHTNLAATAGGIVTQIRGLAAGAHTIVVTNTSGNLFLEGFYVYNGDEAKGFNVYEAGHAGANSGDAIQTNSSAYDAFRMVAPHLAIIDFTTNDWAVGASATTSRISPRATEANLRDLIAAARSADTDPSFIVVEPVKRGVISATAAMKGPWSEYTQAIRRVARADGRVTLFDQQAALGDFSTGVNPNANADQVHFSAAGNIVNAQAIADLIAHA